SVFCCCTGLHFFLSDDPNALILPRLYSGSKKQMKELMQDIARHATKSTDALHLAMANSALQCVARAYGGSWNWPLNQQQVIPPPPSPFTFCLFSFAVPAHWLSIRLFDYSKGTDKQVTRG